MGNTRAPENVTRESLRNEGTAKGKGVGTREWRTGKPSVERRTGNASVRGNGLRARVSSEGPAHGAWEARESGRS